MTLYILPAPNHISEKVPALINDQYLSLKIKSKHLGKESYDFIWEGVGRTSYTLCPFSPFIILVQIPWKLSLSRCGTRVNPRNARITSQLTAFPKRAHVASFRIKRTFVALR
ncbi:hypothetical protein ABKN59_008347 [Abortiporus biennis]